MIRYAAVSQTILNYLNACTVKPDATQIGQLETFWQALVTAGIQNEFDALYLLGGASSDADACLNLINPSNFPLTVIGAGGSFTVAGYAGDGLASVLDSGFDPRVEKFNNRLFQQNDAMFGLYPSANVQNAGSDAGNTNTTIITRNTSNGFTARLSANGAITVASAVTDSKACFTMLRTGSNALAAYRNGTALFASPTNPSTADTGTNETFWLGGRDLGTGPTYTTRRIFAWFWGRGSNMDTTKSGALATALATYGAARGAL